MEITIENIKKVLKKEVDARVDIENMDADKSITDQGIDSLDQSSAFLALEDEFNISIPGKEIEKLDTLNKIVAYIKQAKD
jgi:acyl carrier protein